MLERGMRLDEALSIAIDTAPSRKLRSYLGKVLGLVEAGEEVDEAFAALGEVFPPDFISMVRAGATSNSLPDSLHATAEYFRKRAATRQSVLAAAAYPLFLVVAALLVFGIILFMLIPSLHETLAAGNGEVDGTVARMYALNQWLSAHWLTLLAICAAVGFAAALARKQLDRAIEWMLPPLRRHRSNFIYARAARVLHALLKASERLDTAVANTNEILSARQLTEPFDDAYDAMRRGEMAGPVLLADERVPRSFARYFDLGERTDNLPALLILAAETLEKSYDANLKRLTSWLTPVLTLIVGGLIALVVQVLISAVLEVSNVAV